jgi:hypothetical protein
MRIWSLHPKYLDSKGLVALWRETLLAKKVLEGKTKGYRNHPQLTRFKELKNPLNAINKYLETIAEEAVRRNYNFDEKKFQKISTTGKISVNSGQIKYEFDHLLKKLKTRDKNRFHAIKKTKQIQLHPLFFQKKGQVEKWEIL